MAYLKTRRFPQSAAGDLHWPDGDTVLDVPDEQAHHLLRIAGAEFSEVLPGDPDYPAAEPDSADDEPERTPIAEPDPDQMADDEPERPGTHRTRTRGGNRTPLAE